MNAEAAKFTLDTSGGVSLPRSSQSVIRNHLWSDLDPFTQGYVEALFASTAETRWPEITDLYGVERVLECWKPAFSDLSPEALAAILKDCKEFERLYGPHTAEPRIYGRVFWEKRQAGDFDQEPFPPLSASLGDDGKVYLRAAS